MAKSILVIRLSSLGDVVLTLPVFRALREAYPEARLCVLVKQEYAAVLAGSADINEIIALQKGESVRSLMTRVRERRFDVILDLHANVRSRMVSLFSGAARVIRYRKAALARRLYVGFRMNSDELRRHTLDRYLETLRRLDPDQPTFAQPSDQAFAGNPPRSILVIQTAFLGDAVLTTPLVTAIHEQFPSASLTVLCTPEVAEIFRGQPGVSDVILFDKRGTERTMRARWNLIRSVAERHFDVAVIPHRSLTSALIARLAAIPRRIGFSSSQGRWLMTQTVPFQWGVHDVDRNMTLLRALGVEPHRPALHLQPDAAAIRTVDERLRQAGVRAGQRVVGIHAGSVWATKRWLPEGFAEVADRLQQENAAVIFVGGGKDRDLTVAMVARMKTPALNWVGETNLAELIATIARCSVFLTNDSGPMHIAVACGVPTVAIFGPTTRELGFFPYGAGHRVIEKDLDCRPCGLHGARECPLGHFKCMRLITPDEVLGAVRDQLAVGPSPAKVQGI